MLYILFKLRVFKPIELLWYHYGTMQSKLPSPTPRINYSAISKPLRYSAVQATLTKPPALIKIQHLNDYDANTVACTI